MIKLTRTVVDEKGRLIGFAIEAKASELGGIGDQLTQSIVSTQQIINVNLNNTQVKIENGTIVEKDNFSMHDLPMSMYTKNHGFAPVDSVINLIMRYEKDNENIGFRVQFGSLGWGNMTADMKYDNIINLSRWFKPGNFVVRTMDNGKKYIAGKGIRLEELPATTLGEKSKAKKATPVAPKVSTRSTKARVSKEQLKEMEASRLRTIDVLDLYETIQNHHGYIVKVPDTREKGTEQRLGQLTLLGIEVADPVLQYNSSKLKVHAHFRKIGYKDVQVRGQNVRAICYVNNTTCVFDKGENLMKKFIAAVPKGQEEDFLKELNYMQLKKYEYESDIFQVKPLNHDQTKVMSKAIGIAMGDSNDFSFYALDTGKLDLMSDSRLITSRIGADDMIYYITQLYGLKILWRSLNRRLGETELIETKVRAFDLKPTGSFANVLANPSWREVSELENNCGIDAYTGHYVYWDHNTYELDEYLDYVDDYPDEDDHDIKIKYSYCNVKDEGIDCNIRHNVDDTDVYYALRDYYHAKDVGDRDDVLNRQSFLLSEEIAKLLVDCYKTDFARDDYKVDRSDPEVSKKWKEMQQKSHECALRETKKLYDKVTKKINLINEKIWRHNTRMYIKGNGKSIYTDSEENWIIDTSGKAETPGTTYAFVYVKDGFKEKRFGFKVTCDGIGINAKGHSEKYYDWERLNKYKKGMWEKSGSKSAVYYGIDDRRRPHNVLDARTLKDLK